MGKMMRLSSGMNNPSPLYTAPPDATPLGLRDTQTQTVRHMRCSGTGGSALLRLGARRASPPPRAGAQSTARGSGQSEGGGAAHTGGGGGGAQRRGPGDTSRSQCEEARPPREDTPPPPAHNRWRMLICGRICGGSGSY